MAKYRGGLAIVEVMVNTCPIRPRRQQIPAISQRQAVTYHTSSMNGEIVATAAVATIYCKIYCVPGLLIVWFRSRPEPTPRPGAQITGSAARAGVTLLFSRIS